MKLLYDDALDAAFGNLASNGSLLVIASDSSTNYADVDSTGDTRVIATVSLTTSDYTIQAGDVSGRKVTISSHDSLDILHTDVADNCYILDTANSNILLVTGISSTQTLTTGNKLNQQSFDDEILDPA